MLIRSQFSDFEAPLVIITSLRAVQILINVTSLLRVEAASRSRQKQLAVCLLMAGSRHGATSVEVYGFVGWISSFVAAGEASEYRRCPARLLLAMHLPPGLNNCATTVLPACSNILSVGMGA